MKKILAILLTVILVMGVFAGCGRASTDGEDKSAGKEKIVFWYMHGGPEGQYYEDAIKAFNESQDKYEVEGLSIMDKQKFIVGMSGNDGPDVIEVSNQDILTYANSGLLEPMDEMAKNNGYDVEAIYAKQGLESNKHDGVLYGLPYASTVIQMFYNKDILEELGYSEPPKTMEELYKMAAEATQVDENGVITRLGYPLFPLASARQELIYAFGGRWWDTEGNPTPDDPAILDSLKMNVAFREKYGIEKVQAFVASANTNRYTENDMFFAGKQLFRFDGPWLATQAAQYGPDVNFGVTLIPGTEAHPELRGTSRFETNTVAISAVSKHKEAAWEFAKFLSNSQVTKDIVTGIGNMPITNELLNDSDVLSLPYAEAFIDAVKTGNGVCYPDMEDFAKYISLIEEHLDYVYNGMKTPQEAMAELAKQAQSLK